MNNAILSMSYKNCENIRYRNIARHHLSSTVIVVCWIIGLIELNRLLSSLGGRRNWVSYHVHHMLSRSGLRARKRYKILSLLLTMRLLGSMPLLALLLLLLLLLILRGMRIIIRRRYGGGRCVHSKRCCGRRKCRCKIRMLECFSR